MSRPDSTAVAALQNTVIRPVYFAFLDIVGDPVRANTSGFDFTPSGTGDTDLDGNTFVGINAALVNVSPVRFKTGGSETVTASLSGIPTLDQDVIDALSDDTNWQGRDAVLWRIIRNASNVQQGAFHRYYTGKMTDLNITGNVGEQKITLSIEGYLAALNQASNRTYLSQSNYNPNDESARAAIAIANGDYGYTGSGRGGGTRPGGPQSDPRNLQEY